MARMNKKDLSYKHPKCSRCGRFATSPKISLNESGKFIYSFDCDGMLGCGQLGPWCETPAIAARLFEAIGR